MSQLLKIFTIIYVEIFKLLSEEITSASTWVVAQNLSIKEAVEREILAGLPMII